MLSHAGGLVLRFTRRVIKLSYLDKGLLFLTACIAVSLKLYFSLSGPSDFTWILFPTVKLVEAFTGISFLYDPVAGYRNPDVAIVINKGCAGVNYLVIVLCMTIFSFLPHISRRKLPAFACLVAAAYLVTVTVNSFRIIGGIALVNFGEQHGFTITDSIHEAEGILFYFVFLIGYYFVIRTLVNEKGWTHERTA